MSKTVLAKRGETPFFCLAAPRISKNYGLKKLVYFESFEVVENAIKREKQLKAGKRSTKIQLIEQENPKWNDLSADWWE